MSACSICRRRLDLHRNCEPCPPARAALVALAMKWRGEGEYWRGTWDDEARQQCADDLLVVLGEDPKTFTLGHPEVEAALEDYALPGHPSNADRLAMRMLREREREERVAWDELAKLAEADES